MARLGFFVFGSTDTEELVYYIILYTTTTTTRDFYSHAAYNAVT